MKPRSHGINGLTKNRQWVQEFSLALNLGIEPWLYACKHTQ